MNFNQSLWAVYHGLNEEMIRFWWWSGHLFVQPSPSQLVAVFLSMPTYKMTRNQILDVAHLYSPSNLAQMVENLHSMQEVLGSVPGFSVFV